MRKPQTIIAGTAIAGVLSLGGTTAVVATSGWASPPAAHSAAMYHGAPPQMYHGAPPAAAPQMYHG